MTRAKGQVLYQYRISFTPSGKQAQTSVPVRFPARNLPSGAPKKVGVTENVAIFTEFSSFTDFESQVLALQLRKASISIQLCSTQD
jgi:hypothetical protein